MLADSFGFNRALKEDPIWPRLIGNFFIVVLPIHKCLLRFVAQQLRHGNGARLRIFCDLFINKVVVKLNVGGVDFGVGVVNLCKARPINGGQAHGTRLATCVNNGAGQIEIIDVRAGGANGHHFRMRGGIVAGSDAVETFANNLGIFHNYGAKWTAVALRNIFSRQGDRAAHELLVLMLVC